MFRAALPAAERLDALDTSEQQSQLGLHQRVHVMLEDLCHERAPILQHATGHVNGREDQLTLHVLVDLVQARDVWCPVRHHKLHFLALEVGRDGLHTRFGGDVTAHHAHTRDGGHFLQIHRDHRLHTTLLLWIVQALTQHLAPATRGRAKVHRMRYTLEHSTYFITLQQLKRGPRPEPVALGVAVVHVTTTREFTHSQ